VDNTSTRWGRFRPYLLFGSVPLLLLLVATFSIPRQLAVNATLAWAVVSYALFSLAYSFVNIPYGSLAAAMTVRPEERARLSSGRAVSASLTILLIAFVVAPQIQGSSNLQRSLTITTAVFAIIGFLLYLWCFATSHERVGGSTESARMKDTLAMIRHNRPLVILCAATLLFLTGLFAISSVAIFYARDVLGNADLYIAMTVAQTLAMVGGAAVVPSAVSTIGKTRAYIVAGGIAALAAVGFALSPPSQPALGVACYGILGIGLGAINALIFALQADTVEYGEWKSGVRAEGASYALLSFTRKAGQGIGGAAAAFTISLGGYLSGAAHQTSGAILSIRVAAGIVPAVAVAAAVACMFAYPLSENAFRKIVAELAVRRASAAIPEPVTADVDLSTETDD
jgi:glucuronide carrier protein